MFESLKQDDKKKLLIVLLITDGYITIKRKYPKISYFSNDKILLKIFTELMKYCFDLSPSTIGENYVEYTKSKICKKIYHELNEMCGDISKQSKNIDLTFLKNSSPEIIINAIRLAMSTEGSISISRKENGGIRGKLAFACANPKLCNEWLEIFEKANVKMKIGKDKNVYSGIHGLQIVSEDDIINFEKIGGFIEDVKVQRGHRFRGYDKNRVLKAYTNFIDNKRDGKLKLYTKMNSKSFWSKIGEYVG